MNLATTKTWYWNTDRGFPLAAAAALPIAAAALAEVDAGSWRSASRSRFDALDLSPPPSLISQRLADAAGQRARSPCAPPT